MKLKVPDLAKILGKYSNVWLALESGTYKVVATGRQPGEVLKAARKKGVAHPVLTKAPEKQIAYILNNDSSV